MVVLRIDPYLTTNHIGHVTSSTLLQLKTLNKGWISVAVKTDPVLQPPSSTKQTGDEIVQRNFADHEEKRNNYVLQLVVVNDYYFEDDDTSEKGTPFCSNSYLAPNAIYISQTDHFNMLKQTIDVYRKQRSHSEAELEVSIATLPESEATTVTRPDLEVSITTLPELLVEKQKYVTHKASVSLITCPAQEAVHQDTVDEVLKDHFSTAKLLNKNEVFTAEVQRHHPHSIRAPHVLWFVVSSIDDDLETGEEVAGAVGVSVGSLVTTTRFVSFKDTELMLRPSTKAFVPRCPCTVKNHSNAAMCDFLSSQHFKKVFEKYYSQLSGLFNILKTGCIVHPSDATLLLEAPRGFGKGLMSQAFCLDHCIHYFEQNCYDLIGESLSATEKRIEIMLAKALKCSPCLLYLKNIHVLCKDKEGFNEERRILQFLQNQIKNVNNVKTKADKKYYPLLIVGSTFKSSEMSARFYSVFLYHIEYDALNDLDRELLLKALFKNLIGSKDLKETAKRTSGFILSDLIALLKKVLSESPSNDTVTTTNKEGQKYLISDILPSIEEIRSLKAGGSSGDSVNIPKVSWKDVGGLEDAKKDIFDTIELPMKFPELFQGGLQRSGLLFYGPPGCGKTLLAKAIATEFTLNFYNVKGPELLNMYVGQSEENVREVFKKARRMAPCVVFFDELDSLAPARGRSGDSGGVMDRVVSQLLAELDGMHNNTDVFIIGATNRPDLLDTALLRPGRFDKMIYVGVPEDRDERMKLLKAVTRQMKISEDVHLDQLLDMCPHNLTGADFKALASDALKCCFRRLITEHKEHGTKLDPAKAIITDADFKNAIECCVPSVSLVELERYMSIRDDIKLKDR